MAVFMQPIYTQAVGATPVSAINFNNIPQTFTDLKLVISPRTGYTGNMASGQSLFTNVSTNVFSARTIISDNVNALRTVVGTAQSGWNIGDTMANGSSATANVFGTTTVYIPNYTSTTKYKQVKMESFADDLTYSYSYIEPGGGQYASNAAVLSLSVGSGGFNYIQYSTFTLYGILQPTNITAI
jgi:hypothetical protein